MPGIEFSKYAFATASPDEPIPGREVGSLKGFDFSSLHTPTYGDFLFYGNMHLSEFKFNPDITDLPKRAFGGQQFHNFGLTEVDLSSYTKLDGSLRQCFNCCDNIKNLNLANTDSYYLENHDVEDMASLETIYIGVKKSAEGTCFINWQAIDIFQRLPKLKDIYIVSECPLSEVKLPESGQEKYVFEDCGVEGQNITIHYSGTEGIFGNINDFALNCSQIVAINQK